MHSRTAGVVLKGPGPSKINLQSIWVTVGLLKLSTMALDQLKSTYSAYRSSTAALEPVGLCKMVLNQLISTYSTFRSSTVAIGPLG